MSNPEEIPAAELTDPKLVTPKFHTDGTTAIVGPFPCPYGCGYVMDAAGEVDGTQVAPDAGDVGLCLNCGTPFLFDVDARPRLPDHAELATLLNDPVVQEMCYRIVTSRRDR